MEKEKEEKIVEKEKEEKEKVEKEKEEKKVEKEKEEKGNVEKEKRLYFVNLSSRLALFHLLNEPSPLCE